MNGIELVGGTNDIGFVTDREGTIFGWNEAAEESFDVAVDQVIGKPCWEVLEGRDSFGNDYCGPNCPLIQMALEGRRVRRSELFLADASGTARCYSVAILLLRGVEPLDPAIVHLLHPRHWERRRRAAPAALPSGNHTRGELTPRELEVLAQLEKGRGTAEIARALRISEKTTRNHIQSVLHKLRVHSRVEAVALTRNRKLA